MVGTIFAIKAGPTAYWTSEIVLESTHIIDVFNGIGDAIGVVQPAVRDYSYVHNYAITITSKTATDVFYNDYRYNDTSSIHIKKAQYRRSGGMDQPALNGLFSYTPSFSTGGQLGNAYWINIVTGNHVRTPSEWFF